MLAAIEDIAWQPSDWQVRSPEQHQDQANTDDYKPHPEQHLPDFSHGSILKGKAFAAAKALYV